MFKSTAQIIKELRDDYGIPTMIIEAEVSMIKEMFFIPCENDAEMEGCWISDVVAEDGSRAVYSGKRGECPIESGSKCIGRLMPSYIDMEKIRCLSTS